MQQIYLMGVVSMFIVQIDKLSSAEATNRLPVFALVFPVIILASVAWPVTVSISVLSFIFSWKTYE